MVQQSGTLILIVILTALTRGHILGQQTAKILVGPNILVSRSADGSTAELKIAADPTRPERFLTSGIFFRNNGQRTTEQETRAYYSSDGGNSWRTIIFPEAVAFQAGDPIVEFGLTGTAFFLTGLLNSPRTDWVAYRSEDGGLTWGKPVTIASQGDQPKIIVDRTTGKYAGYTYVTYTCHPHSDSKIPDYHICLYRSVDDGRTWTGPVNVADNHDRRGRGLLNADSAVFTNGQLFVPFTDSPRPLTLRTPYRFWFAISSDGGSTFSVPQKFRLASGGEIDGPYNPRNNPVFVIDNSTGPFRDRIYMAWLDRAFKAWVDGRPTYWDDLAGSRPARLLVSFSADRGKSWAKPRVVDPVPVGDQVGPVAIAVNDDGTVAVSWYDTRRTPAASEGLLSHRYFAASVDGGETFLPAVQLSSEVTDYDKVRRNAIGATPRPESGNRAHFMLRGDVTNEEYLGITADSKGTFYPVWTDGRTGSMQMWTAAVRVERNEVSRTRGHFIESDISNLIEFYFDPLRPLSQAGYVELPVRLRNLSRQPIYGPIKVEVTEITGRRTAQGFLPLNPIANSLNGKSGVGAIFDYTRALGDFGVLLPGGISEGVVWRIKAAANASELPMLRLKVIGRIEPPTESTPKP